MENEEKSAKSPGVVLSINRFFSRIFDAAGTGNAFDRAGEWMKSNTRPLSAGEIEEAQKVFGNLIPYGRVRVDESSALASLGARLKGAEGMGMVLAHTIHFNRPLKATPGSSDMKWLIHELTHVAQYALTGLRYIGEALHAQATTGYAYGGPKGLAGKRFADFNREQQAEIAADYYFMVLYGTIEAKKYAHVIEDLRAGKL